MLDWGSLSVQQQAEALARPAQQNSDARTQAVREIIQQVQHTGDEAVLRLTQQFDGVALNSLCLDTDTIADVAAHASDSVKQAIDLAYDNIYRFHAAQQAENIALDTMPGVHCELRYQAIPNVGLYVPGGSAPLPSTVLMLGIPAQIAGCTQRVLATPPIQACEHTHYLNPAIAYAAMRCGITQIVQAGGAQAIAALAYGTASVKKMDKLYGPGNSFVTEAKQHVSLDVAGAAIDMPAGPSEVLVLADAQADPAFVAADLLSQAEHGPDSQTLLIATDAAFITAVKAQIEQQLSQLPRADIAAQAMRHSRSILVADRQQAVEVCNAYGPEHLIIQMQNPEALLTQLTSAASIFVGPWTPESVGDYASGTNHVLPTYGYSRVLSSLGLADFYRRFTVQTLSASGLQQLGQQVMQLADAEGLSAHKQAVALRLAKLDRLQDAESNP